MNGEFRDCVSRFQCGHLASYGVEDPEFAITQLAQIVIYLCTSLFIIYTFFVIEADQQEQINRAQGEANALLAVAEAKSKSIRLVADALKQTDGYNAASLKIAESYVEAFGKLAKSTNTVIIPSNTSDVSSMVTQAMSIYKSLTGKTRQTRKLNEDDK